MRAPPIVVLTLGLAGAACSGAGGSGASTYADAGGGPGPGGGGGGDDGDETDTCGNGLDDDDDGTIDDGCACEAGSSQPCFAGPAEAAGGAGAGGCGWGTQRCIGEEEFGTWGPCEDVEDGPSCMSPTPDGGGSSPAPDGGSPTNTSCSTAIDVTPSGPGVTVTKTATTCGGVDTARLACNPRAAPEVYYTWTSPDEWYEVVWTISPGFAVGLIQEEDVCGDGPYDCEYEDFAFYRHTHTLVVESTGANCGPFTLSVTRNY